MDRFNVETHEWRVPVVRIMNKWSLYWTKAFACLFHGHGEIVVLPWIYIDWRAEVGKLSDGIRLPKMHAKNISISGFFGTPRGMYSEDRTTKQQENLTHRFSLKVRSRLLSSDDRSETTLFHHIYTVSWINCVLPMSNSLFTMYKYIPIYFSMIHLAYCRWSCMDQSKQ